MKLAQKGKKPIILTMIIALILSCAGLSPTTASADVDTASAGAGSSSTPIPAGHVRIHYNGDVTENGLWVWGDVAQESTGWPQGATPFDPANKDSYGSFIDVQLKPNAKKINFLIVNRTNQVKDGLDKSAAIVPSKNELWIQQGSDKVYPYEPVNLAPNTVRVHYVRDDQNYAAYGLWNFEDVLKPSENYPSGAAPFANMDRYGAYVDIELKEKAKKIGMIVLDRGNGAKDEKTPNKDKVFNLLDQYNHIWVHQGDDNVYISPYKELPTAVRNAYLMSTSQLTVGFTSTESLVEADLMNDIKIRDRNDSEIPFNNAKITGPETVEIETMVNHESLPISVTYGSGTVKASDWRVLDEFSVYDGDDLGATYHQDGSATLKLWAPVAFSVTADVYDKADATQYIGSVDLTKGDKGVWSVELDPATFGVADLKGYFYQYQVTNKEGTNPVLDPYAKSMAAFTADTEGHAGPDGDLVGKAAIVDLNGTDPEGFDYAKIEGYEKREDAVIWEIHVRDFTSDPSIEGDLNARWGSYSAFKDKLEYLKSLGVTHVQLLPVMAWYYGDETKAGERELEYSAQNNNFNWGYDPHNYFSPDGAYSEDPTDPELRIKELKGMIDAVHEAGMGVVLDVVYTHMAQRDHLNDIVPGYYHWIDPDGNFVGGFGNNLATNHKMAEKLMIDSVKYWIDEYKIDGMRWDMMGDGTAEAVQNAYNAAKEIKSDILFYGEGWNTYSADRAEPDLAGKAAIQAWMDKTNDVGVFSDEIRNELKSGFGSEGQPRFITGGARDINLIFNNIKAKPSNTPSDDPGDIVAYLEAHDNLTLHDVIAYTIKKDPSVPENELEIHKRIRLGNLMIMTSQSTAFLHAGQEYGRTKQWKGTGVPEGNRYTTMRDEADNIFGYFIHDSYDSTDPINMIDWTRATDAEKYPINNGTREYTAGLIELRKSTDAFRLGDMSLVDKNVTLIDAPEIADSDVAIAYKNVSSDGEQAYYVFLNADNQERKLTLTEDLTSGVVLVDNDEAGKTAVKERSGFKLTSNSITLDPLTAVIINKPVSQSQPGTSPGTPSGGSGPVSGGTAAPAPAKPVTEALDKLLASLPKDEAAAAKSIVTALQELGTVADVKVSEVSGKKVASVPADKLDTALTNFQKGLEAVEKALSGNSKLLNQIKAQASVVVKVADQSKDTVEISLPAASLSKLSNAGVTITLVTADASFTTSAKALDQAGAKEVKIAKAIVADTEAQKLLAQANLESKSLKPINGLLGFNVAVVNQNGETKNLTLSQKVNVTLKLSAEELAKISDKRKAGVYLVAADGTLSFLGGKIADGQINLNASQSGNLIVLESGKTFADVQGSWAQDYIEVLAARAIADGVGEGQFAPQEGVTRAQLAVFLGRALGLDVQAAASTAPVFSDVADDQYYTDYISALKQAGIMNGYEDGTFRPNQTITREEMVTLLMRGYSLATGQSINEAATNSSKSFSDLESVSGYAKESLLAASSLGIIEGNATGSFEPKAEFTRAQMAKVLIKLLEQTGQL